MQKPFIIKPLVYDVELADARDRENLKSYDEKSHLTEIKVFPVIRPMEMLSEKEAEIINELKGRANISDGQVCEVTRALRLLEQTGAINDKDKSQKRCLNLKY